MTLRIVFFGIYRIGEAALRALLDASTEVAAVVTKPREAGRVQPVGVLARSRGLVLLEPHTVKDAEFFEWISGFRHDLHVVAGFHRILPERVVELPRHGTINLHFSLLPRYRGPNPWKWVIMNGETETGVTVHRMTRRIDVGDVLAQRRVEIHGDDTGGSLFERLSLTGAELLVETMQQLAAGTISPVAQDESQAAYYPRPTHEQCEIDWTRDAVTIRNLIRGLAPFPGAWARTDRGEEIRILSARCLEHLPGSPGTIVERREGGYMVATGSGGLLIESSADLPVGERLQLSLDR